MYRMLIFCVAFTTVLFNLACAQSSKPVKLKGIIVDARNGKVIPGANIKVLSTNKGASSNADGKFMIHDLSSGIYSLKISYIGYKDKIVTDVTVYENKQNSITIELQESVITGESITVSAGYFTKEDSDIVSFRTFNTEEIRRYPGAGQELSRVISSSAGVVTTGETSQDLMVRGGSPRENGFYVDGIFIPSIKHFEQIDGSSNGPIGLINTNLVNSVDFYAGGFTAAYGKRMSSIGIISYKKPNDEEFSGNLNASLAGFGGMLEGPIIKEKSSFFISVRRSYLDILSDAINAGGAPRYGDIQAKVLYELNKNNELTFLQIYGDSQFSSPLDQAKENGRFTYPVFRNQQNTSGLNLRTFWNENIYTNTSFSYSFSSEELDNKYVTKDSKEFSYDNQYNYLNFRSDSYWKISNQFRLEFGTDLMYTGGKFDYFFDQRTDDFGNTKPELNKNARLSQYESSVFSNMIIKPSHSIILNLGSRTGYNSLNENFTISPRASLQFELSDKFSLSASTGIYRQNLPLYIRSQSEDFKSLDNPYSRHIILGVNYLLGESILLTIEAYDKRYHQLPIQNNQDPDDTIAPGLVFDDQSVNRNLNDNGEAFSRGIDLTINKKIKDGLYGSFTGSLFETKYEDFSGNWRSRDYDVELMLSAVGGYRFNKNWEISARWTYMGSRPYTPIDLSKSSQANKTIRSLSKYNEGRLSAFHSLYLRVDRRFFLDQFTITGFFETWNSYNRENIEEKYWNTNSNSVDVITQFDLLPVGGFKIHF